MKIEDYGKLTSIIYFKLISDRHGSVLRVIPKIKGHLNKKECIGHVKLIEDLKLIESITADHFHHGKCITFNIRCK